MHCSPCLGGASQPLIGCIVSGDRAKIEAPPNTPLTTPARSPQVYKEEDQEYHERPKHNVEAVAVCRLDIVEIHALHSVARRTLRCALPLQSFEMSRQFVQPVIALQEMRHSARSEA